MPDFQNPTGVTMSHALLSTVQLDQDGAIVADLIKDATDCRRYLLMQMAYNESAIGSQARPDVGQYFHNHPYRLPAFDPTQSANLPADEGCPVTIGLHGCNQLSQYFARFARTLCTGLL
jgi:hypothetical protein